MSPDEKECIALLVDAGFRIYKGHEPQPDGRPYIRAIISTKPGVPEELQHIHRFSERVHGYDHIEALAETVRVLGGIRRLEACADQIATFETERAQALNARYHDEQKVA